jgi:hypothetical protein
MLDFVHEDGTTQVSDNTLLIFIDETGQEDLQDKNFPVFGFAGCMCVAKDYRTRLDAPWQAVIQAFPGATTLHAADLRPSSVTQDQLNAINSFFENNAFGRFGAALSDQTAYETPEPIYAAMAAATYNRIVDLAKWVSFDNVVMVFEASERTDKLMANYFSVYNFDENGAKIPVQRFRATKSAGISGLMVADFIAHTAGASVHARLQGKITKNTERRDFKVIFDSFGSRLSTFIDISSVKKITSPQP